jgi:hypothetical protein
VSLLARLERARAVGFTASELVAAAGEFFDGAAFFEFIEHAEEGAGVGFPEMESPGDIWEGGGISGNLKKTKDIVGAEL